MAEKSFKIIGHDGQTLQNLEQPLHPGYIIAMEIDARALKKKDVAEQLHIKPQNLSEIMNEKRHVSAMLAVRLETLFDIEADFWMRVQASYDLIKARKKISFHDGEKKAGYKAA